MEPSQRPLSSAVAATPIVLACATCDVESTLDSDRDRQRTELAAFFAVHNGHAGRQRYSVTVPVQRDLTCDSTRGTVATVATSLLCVPLLICAGSWRLIDQVIRRYPIRQHWHFI